MHFEENQFEKNRCDGKKKLKYNAVPTIFNIPNPPKKIQTTRRLLTKQKTVTSSIAKKENIFRIQQPTQKKRKIDHSYFKPVTIRSNDTNHATTTTFSNVISDYAEKPEINDTSTDKSIEKIKICFLEKKLAEEKLKNRSLQWKNATLRHQHEKLKTNVKKIFKEDQIEHLMGNKSFPWCNETLNTGLQVRVAVGKNGYEYLRKVLGYPLPSYRLLCSKVEVLHMAPGIQDQLFELIELKTKDMVERNRQCVLLLDEVQLQEKVEYDNGLKKLIGIVSPEFTNTTNEPADHALVYMIKGLCIPYKQTIAWFLTGKHTNGAQLWAVTKLVIRALYERGLYVKVVTSDMGGSNVGMWKQAGINVDNSDAVSYVPHPSNSSINLYFMADVPHLIKNMRNCLENQILMLPHDIVSVHKLPCAEVSIKHIETIISLQDSMELKLVPGLTQTNIHPGKYSKMKVKNSTKIFSHRTSSVLHDLADSGAIDFDAHSIGWFCGETNKWFDNMANRQFSGALSAAQFVRDKRISQLESYLDLISRVTVYGKRGTSLAWKP
jgi:hypothetical protein